MPAHKPLAVVEFPPEGNQVYVYGPIAPEAATVAEPLQVQPGFVAETVVVRGSKGKHPLFIVLIQAAFAALFGLPGVSFPATGDITQFA